jgi:hypothetical protein
MVFVVHIPIQLLEALQQPLHLDAQCFHACGPSIGGVEIQTTLAVGVMLCVHANSIEYESKIPREGMIARGIWVGLVIVFLEWRWTHPAKDVA